MAYGLVGTLTATPGRRDDLVAHLLRAADALRANPDCHLYLVGTTDAPDDVTVVELWTDEAAHDASLSHPAVRALISEGRPLVAAMSGRVVLDVVGGIGPGPLPGQSAS